MSNLDKVAHVLGKSRRVRQKVFEAALLKKRVGVWFTNYVPVAPPSYSEHTPLSSVGPT